MYYERSNERVCWMSALLRQRRRPAPLQPRHSCWMIVNCDGKRSNEQINIYVFAARVRMHGLWTVSFRLLLTKIAPLSLRIKTTFTTTSDRCLSKRTNQKIELERNQQTFPSTNTNIRRRSAHKKVFSLHCTHTRDLDVRIYKCFLHRMIDRYVRTPYSNNNEPKQEPPPPMPRCVRVDVCRSTVNKIHIQFSGDVADSFARRHAEEEKEFHMGH